MTSGEPRSFSRKTLGWIIGLAAGSFVLALVLTGFADDLGGVVSAGNNAFSYSALGHHGLVELLERSGLEVSIRRSERPPALDEQTVLFAAEPLVIDPLHEPPETGQGDAGLPAEGPIDDANDEDDDQDRPRLSELHGMARAESAPFVVVLPKRIGLTNPYNPRWLADTRVLPDDVILQALDPLELEAPLALAHQDGHLEESCDASWGESVRVSIPRAQLLRAVDGLKPLVSCGEHWLVAVPETGDGYRDLYLVSDPDLLNNHGLGRGENARLVHGLLVQGLGAGAVVIDETIHGFRRSSGLLAELFRFPLGLGLAHGALLLGLVLWAGMGRFGKPRTPEAALGSGKRVLIDNTAQLISVAGHTAETLPGYFNQTVRAVAAHYFLPADMPEDELMARLQEIGRARGLELDLQQALQTVETLARAGPRQADRAVKFAVRLHRWREGMTHGD